MNSLMDLHLDLSPISYSNGTKTRVKVQMTSRGPFEPWAFFGSGDIIPYGDGIYTLSGRLGQGDVPATDRSHDPAKVFSIQIVQPSIWLVRGGIAMVHAFIAHDEELFRVPPPHGYKPFEGATFCTSCAVHNHAVVEEYLPPKNEELFRALVGRKIEISFIP